MIYVDHSNDIEPDSIFVSINNGYKHLSAKEIELVSEIWSSESTTINLDKVKVIPDLDSKVLQIIESDYGLVLEDFENFFITGTNGKTTSAQFVSQILNINNINNGAMGTLGCYINGKNIASQRLTTETPIYIRNFLKKCLDRNTTKIIYEASSIGIESNRLEGLSIDHSGFTNFTRDHLDHHKNMPNYLKAKLELVKNTKNSFTYNLDDDSSSSWIKAFSGDSKFSISCIKPSADIFFSVRKIYSDGKIAFDIYSPWGSSEGCATVFTDFNLVNIFIGLPFLMYQGLAFDSFISSLALISLPTGRQKLIKYKSNKIFIDYAHTPDAIEKLLSGLSRLESVKTTLIIGAGGNRDHGKRSLMGSISSKYANHIIITSDNPRGEDPQLIADMIAEGIEETASYEIILDRAKAITTAIKKLSCDETLIIIGKGHEDYQIIGNKRFHFSDEEEVNKCIT